MAKSQRLRAVDVRQMLRLMNELHETHPRNRIEHMLEALCPLLGAQVATWVEAKTLEGENCPRFVAAVGRGWLDKDGQDAFAHYMKGDHAVDPFLRAMAQLPGKHVTRGRVQVVADAQWYRCDYVADYRKTAKVDHNVATFIRVGPNGGALATQLLRAWGEKPFDRRERLLLHLFHSELGWMYEPIVRAGEHRDAAALSPRQRQVLALLLDGHSEKQVAARLRLKPPTVHEYVTSLYKKMKVTSRSELLARFVTARENLL